MTAVLLAFVIFFSLVSYQHARDGASVEGVAVTELHDVADVLEGHSAGLCTADLSAIRAPSSPMSGLR